MSNGTILQNVVIGLIQSPSGLVLIGQRPPDKAFPLKWEFPGGKVESGESLIDALCRELQEELGIEVHPNWIGVPLLVRPAHEPGWLLNFYRIPYWQGYARPIVHIGLTWQRPLAIWSNFDYINTPMITALIRSGEINKCR